MALRLYSTSEGLNTDQMNGGVQPAGAITPSGELWFPSTNGAVRIDPRRARSRLGAAGADRAGAGGRAARAQVGPGRSGAGEGNLEIQYTAIRLRSPEHTRFKYWMEGFDPDWTDAGARRIAYYTALPPGAYTFHVVAYEVNDPSLASQQTIGVDTGGRTSTRPRGSWRCARPRPDRRAGRCALARAQSAATIRGGAGRTQPAGARDARYADPGLCRGFDAAGGGQRRAGGVAGDRQGIAGARPRRGPVTVDEARLAVWNLRQNSGNGSDLVVTLSQLAQRIGLETGIPVRFETAGAPLTLGAEGERSLMMLVREALQNAVRHAAAKNLSIVVSSAATWSTWKSRTTGAASTRPSSATPWRPLRPDRNARARRETGRRVPADQRTGKRRGYGASIPAAKSLS